MVCRAAAVCVTFPSLSVVAGMPAEPNQLKYDQEVFGLSSPNDLVEASLFPLLKYGNNRQNKDVPTRPRSIHKGAVGMMYGSGYLQSGSAHRRRTLAYLQSRDEPIKVLGSSHMTK